jgi:hypothetical protein
MTRARSIAFGAFAGVLALASPAAAEPADQPQPKQAKELAPQPTVSSLEITGAFGPSILFGDPANPGYVESFSRAGVYGELGIAYRSKYFVDPFLTVGYGTLARGTSDLPDGTWGAGGAVEQDLGAWVISPGITTDIWRFRPRIGFGLAVVVQRFEFQGETHSSTQLPLVTQLGLGFNAFDDGRFRLDVETRGILAPGADVRFMTIDAVFRGDLFYFVHR